MTRIAGLDGTLPPRSWAHEASDDRILLSLEGHGEPYVFGDWRLIKMKADVNQPPAGILKVQELMQAFFGDT